MVDEVITKQELIDAQKDAQSLDDFINGGDEQIVVTRLLKEYPTLANAIRQIYEKGGKFYPTLAAANADIANIRTDIYVITGDNGAYYKATAGATTLTKSPYDPVEQAKNYADANPLFKTRNLTAGEDVHNLRDGNYRINTAEIAATILNLPPQATPPVMGNIIVRRGVGDVANGNSNAYMLFIKYDDINQKYEKTGNGGTSNFVWKDWVKVPSTADLSNLETNFNNKINEKATINLFPNLKLDSANATLYEATNAVEDGKYTATMDASKISSIFYEQPIDENYLSIDSTIYFKSEIKSDGVGSASGDLSIVFLDASGVTISTHASPRPNTADTWQEIQVSATIPANTAKIRYRLIRRLGNTYVKFRSPSLLSNYAFISVINPLQQSGISSSSSNIMFVGKSGSDSTGDGSRLKPYSTIMKAHSALPSSGGEIVVMDSDPYRETLTLDSFGKITIRPVADNRVNLFGSNQLVVTKSTGYTKVYQAPLAAKPTGMGSGRGEPLIAEWGTKSKPIDENKRRFLNRGQTHRLPYTEMFEAATLAELDTPSGNGKWWWESGTIYFAATDGSDARLKRYEARIRQVLNHTNGSIELIRVDSWFSADRGMNFNGLYTKRSDCRAYGAYRDGFSDNANVTESYRDDGGGNGNDGFNGTVTDYATKSDANSRLEAVYLEPWGHDNGDDGFSYHYRADSSIYGGLFQYNTKADVVHVTGANCACYDTETMGTLNGFYAATAPDGDAERVKTMFRCVNPVSTENGYAYRSADNAELQLLNPIAEDPTIMGFYQTGTGAIRVKGKTLYKGDPAKIKSGNVIVDTYTQVT